MAIQHTMGQRLPHWALHLDDQSFGSLQFSIELGKVRDPWQQHSQTFITSSIIIVSGYAVSFATGRAGHTHCQVLFKVLFLKFIIVPVAIEQMPVQARS